MAETNLFRRLESFMRTPVAIQKEILRYYVKRITFRKPTSYETIWTSFFYFSVSHVYEIKDGDNEYVVEFNLNGERTRARIRGGASSDVFVFFQVFIANGYQPLVDLLKQRNFVPKIVVDVGANVGYFSMLIRNVFRNARIVAVEPQPGNFKQLKKNLEHDSMTQFIQAALWTHDALLHMKDESAQQWAFQLTGDLPGAGNYQGFGLHTLILKSEVKKIDLLKLDIEGAEAKLFDDAAFLHTLNSIPCLALEIHDQYADRSVIHDRLLSAGFVFSEQGELTTAFQNNLLA